MKSCFILTLIILNQVSSAQSPLLKEYGLRAMHMLYKGDTVHIVIRSKKGEENKPKPLFLFCQGSLPVPLLIRYKQNESERLYNLLPFRDDSLVNSFHIAVVGKPYIPLMQDLAVLNKDMTFSEASGSFPEKYVHRNLLSYYVPRNIEVIKFLQKQSWISKSKLVVSGHSEGSSIAAKIASLYPVVTHLIYSGGNPMGRIMSIIERARATETDSTLQTEMIFNEWKEIIGKPNDLSTTGGDPNKVTYEFSEPPLYYLEKLKIPVLVTYGTKDAGLVAFADYLRVEMIRKKKNNFKFIAYPGLEHNFFPVKPDGSINYDVYNWDKVAEDWYVWLIKN